MEGRGHLPGWWTGPFTRAPCDPPLGDLASHRHSAGAWQRGRGRGGVVEGAWQGDVAEVAVLPTVLTLPPVPPPSSVLPGIWGSPSEVGAACLCPVHAPSPPLRCREPGVASGETFGQVPRAYRAGRPLLSQKEEGRRSIWGQSLHPHPLCGQKLHPVTWPLGEGPALGVESVP